jgi:hypothetical protein
VPSGSARPASSDSWLIASSPSRHWKTNAVPAPPETPKV